MHSIDATVVSTASPSSKETLSPFSFLSSPPHEESILGESLALIRSDCGVSPHGKRTFVGIGYKGPVLPIDTIGLILSGATSRQLTIVITDEFQRMNGEDESSVRCGAERIERLVSSMNRAFHLTIDTVRSSEIMQGQRYDTIFRNLRSKLQTPTLQKLLTATIPPSKRALDPDSLYTIHELAVSHYLSTYENYEVKLGPSREEKYDTIMQLLSFRLEYAYCIDALPVGTPDPQSAVHYIANDVGRTGGARVLLTDSPETMLTKLATASHDTMDYFVKVARVAQSLRERKTAAEVMAHNVLGHLILPLEEI